MTMQIRTQAARGLSAAWETVEPALWLFWAWIAEKTPIVGRQATRYRRAVVLPPYKRLHTLSGSLLALASIPIVVFGCLVYGFFFGLTVPYLLVPFVIPIALVTVLIIWALPDGRTAPTLPIEFLLPAYFAILVIWPKYLALKLPGTPWITPHRIVGLPMAMLLLISLSVSKPFRSMVWDAVKSVRAVWVCLCAFVLIQLLTTLISKKPLMSAQLVFDEQIYWTSVFVISCVIFRRMDAVKRYFWLLIALSVVVMGVAAVEWRGAHVMWAAHIPQFLRVPDPSVQVTLAPSFRPGTHFYRSKSTFATPNALAEYISLLTPFLLYFATSRINLVLRIFAAALVPITFAVVRLTDSRIGVVGIFGSVLLYGLLWSIVRFRTHSRDLLAAATVYAYPIVFAAGLGLIFGSHRMKAMVLGGNAQASSTDARAVQLHMALDKLWPHPWGYGAGQCGDAIGFAQGEFITIDNYFITVVLDHGILGAAAWYGMFVAAIVVSVRYCVSREYGQKPEAMLLAPLAVSLAVFLVVKWAHGQADNHAVYFLMLGMISALVWRLKNPEKAAALVPVAAD